MGTQDDDDAIERQFVADLVPEGCVPLHCLVMFSFVDPRISEPLTMHGHYAIGDANPPLGEMVGMIELIKARLIRDHSHDA